MNLAWFHTFTPSKYSVLHIPQVCTCASHSMKGCTLCVFSPLCGWMVWYAFVPILIACNNVELPEVPKHNLASSKTFVPRVTGWKCAPHHYCLHSCSTQTIWFMFSFWRILFSMTFYSEFWECVILVVSVMITHTLMSLMACLFHFVIAALRLDAQVLSLQYLHANWGYFCLPSGSWRMAIWIHRHKIRPPVTL
jgi:hypothetical protein